MRPTRNQKAFTLAEVLVAVILLGIGIVSLLAASQSLTQANGEGIYLSTAEFLSEQIRESLTMTDYADLSSFDNVSYNPPIAANGDTLSDFPDYTQTIVVENVNATDFETVVGDGTSDFIRVTVTVSMNGRNLTNESWIRANY